MQLKFQDRLFIMKLHSVIYNQLTAAAYRSMLRYTWQNTGYGIGEPVSLMWHTALILKNVQL